MIYTRDHETGSLFDQWKFLGPKRRKLLEESWAGLFRKEILHELPVDQIAPSFHSGFGRPTKELYTALGALVLQQMNDYSDHETVHQMAFNMQWHYALDIPGESDASKYISPKTLWNFRQIVIEKELDTDLFNQITDKLARVFSVDTDKQRIDSVHIKSNMRRLGRLGIFAKSIHCFLVNLKRHHPELFKSLPTELVDKYLKKEAIKCFSMVKPSESEKTLCSVSKDLFMLVERFKDTEAVNAMRSFKILRRILREHCDVEESSKGAGPEVIVKPTKEVPSDSLQNPSDPDAGYSGHKGQGYQVQMMETYSRGEEVEDQQAKLNLITHVEVEPAHAGDAHALLPAIESTRQRGLGPKEVLADSLYGSDENGEAARARGVELISPTLGTLKEDRMGLKAFEFSASGDVLKCPAGEIPLETKKNKLGKSAAFEAEICLKCPRASQCPVRPGKKKYHYLRYTEKQLRIATRRAKEEAPEFKDRYRYRAGIEATMSLYDRLTGVKALRVRGLKAVRFSAILKAIGVNIHRATAFRRAEIDNTTPSEGVSSVLGNLISDVKERFLEIQSLLRWIFYGYGANFKFKPKTAA
jgi:hypothetical protein